MEINKRKNKVTEESLKEIQMCSCDGEIHNQNNFIIALFLVLIGIGSSILYYYTMLEGTNWSNKQILLSTILISSNIAACLMFFMITDKACKVIANKFLRQYWVISIIVIIIGSVLFLLSHNSGWGLIGLIAVLMPGYMGIGILGIFMLPIIWYNLFCTSKRLSHIILAVSLIISILCMIGIKADDDYKKELLNQRKSYNSSNINNIAFI
ncbi:MAG TPA: hypothetical protein DCP90_01815 [Clostridiales bacterium]|nr:MAG: hypothetical protein A2Y22_03375 [Clostridiales bacterium GWD2_32_59]HAN09331.1 hypothetical protein [Clostridiales bacterium]